MSLAKPGRQLELFIRMSVVRIKIPLKTMLKIKSLLADLIVGVWLSNKPSRKEAAGPQGGRGE